MRISPLQKVTSFALKSGLAEDQDEHALVAVLDSFRPSSSGPSHGFVVESILRNHGSLTEEQIELYHADSRSPFPWREVFESSPGCLKGKLSEYFVFSGKSFYDCINDNLELIVKKKHPPRFVNVSQSQSILGLCKPFLAAIDSSAKFRTQLRQGLSLPDSSAATEITSAVFKVAQTSISGNNAFADASERFKRLSLALKDRGVQIVVSVGNLGSSVRALNSRGIRVEEALSRSFLAEGETIVVGALSLEGNVASTNPPEARVDMLAPGERVPYVFQGRTLAMTGSSASVPLACLHLLLSDSGSDLFSPADSLDIAEQHQQTCSR